MILRWLLPIGFVGLVAIAVLLVVYLLRPQYREKRVSGTIVWKRVALRTKKQRLMFSNLLIFLVQAFVLTLIAVGLAEPRLYTSDTVAQDSEYVVVLDASASMRAKSSSSNDTRFERAKAGVKEKIDEFFEESEDGVVSLIIADNQPSYLFSDLKKDRVDEIYALLDAYNCTLEGGDLEGAVALAGNRLESNPHAKILFYTDTQFGNLGTAVEIVNVADGENEQNIAILGCTVGRVDNQYAFEIVLGAYGNVTRKCNVSIDIKDADNGDGARDLHLDVPVNFSVNENSTEQIQRVMVMATDEKFGGQPDWFFDKYDGMEISIENLNDSISEDDRYFVYGGIRDPIDIEYWSGESNGFWKYGFINLANNMSKFRDITFKEIYQDQGMLATNSGYDFYIFEHSIPDEILESGLPKDGVILLVDPSSAINDAGVGISFGQTVQLDALTSCSAGAAHPLTQYMQAERIHLTKYSQLEIEDGANFETLLYIDNSPALLFKNTSSVKLIVMPFSINMSDFYGEQFQIFLYNLLNYFMPATLTKFDFELGQTAQFDCKGETLEVEHNGSVQTFTQFPGEITFAEEGTYTFKTTFGLEKEDEVRKVYVHMPISESNLFTDSDFRINLDNKEAFAETQGRDFFVWFAVMSLILMIIEWYLQFKYIL